MYGFKVFRVWDKIPTGEEEDILQIATVYAPYVSDKARHLSTIFIYFGQQVVITRLTLHT